MKPTVIAAAPAQTLKTKRSRIAAVFSGKWFKAGIFRTLETTETTVPARSSSQADRALNVKDGG